MAVARLVLHPLLSNKRSRFIFVIFMVIGIISGVISWLRLKSAVAEAGFSIAFGPPSENIFLHLILSPYFRFALILASVSLAAALTAQYVVGPVKRIEQWLLDNENGYKMPPLKVRQGDKFSKLVQLINHLIEIH